MIEMLPEKDYPFGQNIHFAYNLLNEELSFVHPSFSWIADPMVKRFPENMEHRLHPDEYHSLLQTSVEWKSGSVKGIVKLQLNTIEGSRWISLTPFLVRQGATQFILAEIEEYTDEVMNLENTIKYANKKNSILNMLAHDLRGPLAVARSIFKTLDLKSDAQLHKKSEYITSILEQSLDLIDDLTAREFLETTEVVLFKKKIDLVEKISQYIEECKRSASLAERSFVISSSTSSLLTEVDEAKLMQVLNNLLSNSLKFTNPGGQISIGLQEEAGYAVITFSDDGIGIPQAVLPELFDSYSTAGRRGLNGETSLGLGLSIVKTIIDWHQGTITCESEEGKGTTFRIMLPLRS